LLKLVDLLLEFFDDFLTKMRSFGKFLLYFLVDFNVALESLNLRLHFIVLEEQLLSLLRLIFKLSGELVILQNSQASSSLELLIIKS
jgi:hypothetical protein